VRAASEPKRERHDAITARTAVTISADADRAPATSAGVPHWRRIELALRSRIDHLTPGDPLPSDADLCREFGVSRMTARNAVGRLVEEGLIIRVSGRGSYVAEPPAHRRADRLLTFSHEMRRRGRVPTSRVLAREIRPSRPDEAAQLGIAPTEPVVVLRRLRCADDEPIALETALLIQPVASIVLAADIEHGSLHEALARGGWHLRRGTATISAAAATPEDARLLDLRRGDPLLVERRVIADLHGRRVEATESRYPADRYALDVQFDVEPDTDLEAR
jgi:GntR family transcriptional regulator